jgi:threonine dehydrogenase-like Zn-dependent dehydrogenase
MKAVTQNLKTGRMSVEEVPPPVLRPEGVLVRVRRSLISLGTERAVMELARKGMVG